MSRIGKAPIPIPRGVTVTIKAGNVVTVRGPKGELTRTLPAAMRVRQDGEQIVVTRLSDEPRHKSLHGLTRTLIANMLAGVKSGFAKQFELVGVDYKAEVRPHGLQLTFGASHPIDYTAPVGIKLSAPAPTQILIEGSNKEVVGRVAAEIRSLQPSKRPGSPSGAGKATRVPATGAVTRASGRSKSSAPMAKAHATATKSKAVKARATTVRLTPVLQLGLELLQSVLKQPVNKMVNEAVEAFIAKRTAEVETDLQGVLAQIKAYKHHDPDFESAIRNVVDAEAAFGREDPAEGVVVSASTEAGPAQTMVRALLSR